MVSSSIRKVGTSPPKDKERVLNKSPTSFIDKIYGNHECGKFFFSFFFRLKDRESFLLVVSTADLVAEWVKSITACNAPVSITYNAC